MYGDLAFSDAGLGVIETGTDEIQKKR